MWFRILLAIAFIPFATAFYFFMAGIGDGTVGTVNIALWIGLLGVTGGLWAGGLAFGLHGHRAPATMLLLMLAVPTLLAALFAGIILISHPRWN